MNQMQTKSPREMNNENRTMHNKIKAHGLATLFQHWIRILLNDLRCGEPRSLLLYTVLFLASSAFLVIEKAVRQIKGGHSHGHSHSQAPHTPSAAAATPEAAAPDDKKGKMKTRAAATATKKVAGDSKTTAEVGDKKTAAASAADLKVTAYLNLAADAAHD